MKPLPQLAVLTRPLSLQQFIPPLMSQLLWIQARFLQQGGWREGHLAPEGAPRDREPPPPPGDQHSAG
jgi:hypothetical protein